MSFEGQTLGEFEILELLGKGGMGEVYKARQVSLGRFVALKTLDPSLARDPDYIARFRQESKAAAMLSHPNLVQVYSAGETAGLHWFAMEFVEGETARIRLKRKGRIDSLQALAITIYVSMALDHGWRKAGLIHRDIKPDNILLSADGEVKLGDLGLAKSTQQASELTTSGAALGTPHFMSPEQIEDMKAVDFRADIYSLGCTLYYLLAGQPPYPGNSSTAIMVQHLHAPVPDLRVVWPECPKELSGNVQKMMQKGPADRQQTYEELLTDLRRSYDDLSTARPSHVADKTSVHAPVRLPDRKPMARSAAFPATVAGAVVVSATFIAWSFLHHGRNAQLEEARPRSEERAILSSGPDNASGALRPSTTLPGNASAVRPVAEAGAALSTAAPGISSPIQPGTEPPRPARAGDLDPSFGAGGKVVTSLSTEDNWASSIAVQDDGKILVAGLAFDGTAWSLRLVRYHPDGKMDRRIDSDDDGFRTKARTPGSMRATIAIQPDQKIVFTGAGKIARYNPDGSLDSSFGDLGIQSTVRHATQDMTIQADGKIVLAGHTSLTGRNVFAVSRYDANGSPDVTFNGTGMVTTSFESTADICQCVVSQPDGKIIAGGYTTLSTPPDRAFALVRYNTDGSLDTSFNGTGKVTTDITNGGDEANALTVQEDGKILAVGFSTGASRDLTVVRYNRDGSLDTTFNGTGKVMTFVGGTAIGYGVAVQRDGRIVVGGSGRGGLMLVRYTPAGLLDTTLHGTGIVTTLVGGKSDIGTCFALQKDGNILVGGRMQNGKNYDSVIVRYLGEPRQGSSNQLSVTSRRRDAVPH